MISPSSPLTRASPKRARNFAERLNAPLAIVEKRRIGNHGKTESLGLIGSVIGAAYPS